MGATGLSLAELRGAIARVVRSAFPWIASGLVFERYARVVAVRAEAGTSGPLQPRYAVDVQPLTPDLQEDPDWPAIANVPCPVLAVGAGAGVYGLPAVGSVVRLGFAYGAPTCPYVAGVTTWGWTVPDGVSGAIVLRHQSGAEIRLNADGVTITGGTVRVAETVVLGGEGAQRLATERWVSGVFATHVHANHGVPPTPNGDVPGALTERVTAR